MSVSRVIKVLCAGAEGRDVNMRSSLPGNRKEDWSCLEDMATDLSHDHYSLAVDPNSQLLML